MATGNVIVTVVDVGQGQCTFVEIYDDDGMAPTLQQTLLFDCGSDKRSTQTHTNLDYIVNRIVNMATPTIDCIFFSHSDNDHISLMWYLLREIQNELEEDQTLVISKVIYCGTFARYTKRRRNILNYILNQGLCEEDNMLAPDSNHSDYDPLTRAYYAFLWQSTDEDVVVRAMVANVISGDPDWDLYDADLPVDSAEALNRVSLVATLYYGNRSYVICGDATNDTMSATIKRFNNAPQAMFAGNIMTTLPHHGSRITGYAVQGAQQASLRAMLIVRGFADLLKSETITVSAYRKHSHPSLYLMTDFIPTHLRPLIRDPRLQQANAHRVTANIDFDLMNGNGVVIRQDDDQSFETTVNTFSTNYYIGYQTFSYQIGGLFVAASQGLVPPAVPINPFACWQYTTANNNYILVGYPNLALPLAAFTAAVPPPGVAALKAANKPSFRITGKKQRIHKTVSTQALHGIKHFL